MSNLTLVKTNKETVKSQNKLRAEKVSQQANGWHRQYVSTLKRIMEDYGVKNDDDFKNVPQSDLMKLAYAGTKVISFHSETRYLHEALMTSYNEDLESIKGIFSYINGLVNICGHLVLRNFMNIFPVEKDYVGHKHGCKDYFFTMKEVNKMELDEPIGEKALLDLLFNYQNDLIFEFYAEMIHSMSEIRRSQGEKSLCEEFFEQLDIPSFSVNEEAGAVINNLTGETIGLRKSGSIHLVK